MIAQSTQGGWVWHYATANQRRAFITTRPIPCSQCGATIPPGSTYTRHGTRANRHAAEPVCWHCQPFDLIPPHMQRRRVK
jgi:hypothetical protein